MSTLRSWGANLGACQLTSNAPSTAYITSQFRAILGITKLRVKVECIIKLPPNDSLADWVGHVAWLPNTASNDSSYYPGQTIKENLFTHNLTLRTHTLLPSTRWSCSVTLKRNCVHLVWPSRNDRALESQVHLRNTWHHKTVHRSWTNQELHYELESEDHLEEIAKESFGLIGKLIVSFKSELYVWGRRYFWRPLHTKYTWPEYCSTDRGLYVAACRHIPVS